MATNSTISITYKFKGETGGLRAMCEEVERMQQAFRDGVQPAEQLRTSLINFNQLSQAFDAISQIVSSLNGAVQNLAGAYAVQAEAETKLETVMRNTMEATDEQIQSIKDFCSAQQEIGVIGDEVQLAGAQELATYLSLTSTLETLIPVMNDMTAQQYGLGASAESTTQIATMLGKVMNGQTSALSRYGYTFTEAQEQILKTGTEMERAAVLAEVVGESVGGMNAELARTEPGRQQQLANALGDVKEAVGKALTGIAPYVGMAAQLITVASNAGRASSAMRALSAATMGANGMFKFISSGSVAAALGMNAAGKAAAVLAAGLRAIAAATVVTAVISAITMAIDYFIGSAKEAKEAAEGFGEAQQGLSAYEEQARQAAEQETKTLAKLQAQMSSDIAMCKDFQGTKAQEKKIVGELNERYGETMGYFSSVSSWYDALIANSEDYCKQMILEARTRRLANQIADEKEIQYNATHNPDGTEKNFVAGEGIPYNNPMAGFVTQSQQQMKSFAQGIVADSKKREQAYMDQMTATVAELATVTMSVRGAATPPGSGGGSSRTAAAERERTALEQVEDQIRANLVAAQTADQEELAGIAARIAELQKEKEAIEAKVEAVKYKPEPYTPPQTSEIKTIAELEKALSHYEAKLKQAQPEDREEINQTIKKLQELREAWDEALNPKETKKEDPLGDYIDSIVKATQKDFPSMADPLAGMDYSSLIAKYRETMDIIKGMDGDITAEQRASLEKAAKAYATYARKAVSGYGTVKEAWGNVKGVAGGIESISKALEGSGTAWETNSGVVDGALQVFEGLRGIIQLIKMLTEMTQIQTQVTEAQGTATTAEAAAESSAAAEKVAASGAVTTANLQEGASGFFKAHSWVPFVGIGIALAGVAAMIAMMSSLPKYAKGGIAYGPTVGMFGEYSGASHNPEVVAPLDRLRALIGEGQGAGGSLSCTVRGDQLQFVLDRTKRKQSRT